MIQPPSAPMMEALATIAPGRPLREGLDRILQANMGALIVIGDGPEVLEICSGGFLVDAEFSPQRLSELAKMDGAIVLAADASRIARANVHLVPAPSVPTSETGTRHRTAERVARSVNVPVVSVSEDMGLIAVYRFEEKHPLDPIQRLVNRANQALQTLERYRSRFDEVSTTLMQLELEDVVTVRDVAAVLQRAEMVRRIAEEIASYIVELGSEGRLVLLQLEEVMGGLHDDRRLVLRDYVAEDDGWTAEAALGALAGVPTDGLVDPAAVARAVRIPGAGLDATVTPRGHRLLGRIPRLAESVAASAVAEFGSLQRLMRASVADLGGIDGIGERRAQTIKDGLDRLAETVILSSYR